MPRILKVPCQNLVKGWGGNREVEYNRTRYRIFQTLVNASKACDHGTGKIPEEDPHVSPFPTAVTNTHDGILLYKKSMQIRFFES